VAELAGGQLKDDRIYNESQLPECPDRFGFSAPQTLEVRKELVGEASPRRLYRRSHHIEVFQLTKDSPTTSSRASRSSA